MFSDFVGVFLGALLGALFGYGANWHYSTRQDIAERDALIGILSYQLHRASLTLPPGTTDYIVTRSTLHISAIDALITGSHIDPKEDYDLLQHLIQWQSYEASYNEQVRFTNPLIASNSSTSMQIESWSFILNQHLIELLAMRASIITLLPLKHQAPPEGFDPGGQLIVAPGPNRLS